MRRLLAEHRCPNCEIKRSLCFCAEIPRIELRTRVLVLMHTAEEVLTSNTARLACKALANSELRIRGRKDRPMSTEGFVEPGRTALLLFPSPHALESFVSEHGDIEPADVFAPEADELDLEKCFAPEPLAVFEVRSLFFDDHMVFPSGSAVLDSAWRVVERRSELAPERSGARLKEMLAPGQSSPALPTT